MNAVTLVLPRPETRAGPSCTVSPLDDPQDRRGSGSRWTRCWAGMAPAAAGPSEPHPRLLVLRGSSQGRAGRASSTSCQGSLARDSRTAEASVPPSAGVQTEACAVAASPVRQSQDPVWEVQPVASPSPCGAATHLGLLGREPFPRARFSSWGLGAAAFKISPCDSPAP